MSNGAVFGNLAQQILAQSPRVNPMQVVGQMGAQMQDQQQYGLQQQQLQMQIQAHAQRQKQVQQQQIAQMMQQKREDAEMVSTAHDKAGSTFMKMIEAGVDPKQAAEYVNTGWGKYGVKIDPNMASGTVSRQKQYEQYHEMMDLYKQGLTTQMPSMPPPPGDMGPMQPAPSSVGQTPAGQSIYQMPPDALTQLNMETERAKQAHYAQQVKDGKDPKRTLEAYTLMEQDPNLSFTDAYGMTFAGSHTKDKPLKLTDARGNETYYRAEGDSLIPYSMPPPPAPKPGLMSRAISGVKDFMSMGGEQPSQSLPSVPPPMGGATNAMSGGARLRYNPATGKLEPM